MVDSAIDRGLIDNRSLVLRGWSSTFSISVFYFTRAMNSLHHSGIQTYRCASIYALKLAGGKGVQDSNVCPAELEGSRTLPPNFLLSLLIQMQGATPEVSHPRFYLAKLTRLLPHSQREFGHSYSTCSLSHQYRDVIRSQESITLPKEAPLQKAIQLLSEVKPGEAMLRDIVPQEVVPQEGIPLT